ncbi:MAG: dTDP-4-dehydrorhamnose 3,5-epimerase [Sedimentisphaerales bacterium]|nr:dTDP-4-dehydrorhamnose 3,5-epimerase [Sedimentisphaerales bacterium]
MQVLPTKLPGVLLIEPKVFGDSRGFFLETWSRERYAQAGLTVDFVQDNVSFSQHGVLRGLHFQNPQAQGKLVQVLAGEVFDVAVDIRVGSDTFGQWVGEHLSVENHRQLYIPPGFAHGFCVLSEVALFSYKCTEYYDPAVEGGILWNDPEIGIEWPVADPRLSDKDKKYTRLSQVPVDRLPRMGDR